MKTKKYSSSRAISEGGVMLLPITQEHGAGCAVACVAYILHSSYGNALKLFSKPKQAVDRGFVCRDIVAALKRGEVNYAFSKITLTKNKLLKAPAIIVYIAPSKKYPIGHYLAKNEEGLWMNPWLNFPCIAPAQGGFQKRLPGVA